jgi:threonine synthase
MIRFISTRGDTTPKSFTDVLLSGMAPDGGLYVPAEWPRLDLAGMRGLAYTDIAYRVIKPFVGDDIPDDELQAMIVETYENNFSHSAVAPLVQLGPSTWVMELFHGPTIAFKDYALQLLGRLFDYVLEKQRRKITIVGATSGDTGSAAIEGCKACENVNIFILHPKDRTSEVQRRQMTGVDSPNVFNIALEGNFDDCQKAVKAMFADKAFREEMDLSAVNSFNWARIMEMKAEAVEPSLSPSMDIQVSSNFERFLFDLLGRNGDDVRAKMESFRQSGSFTVDDKHMKKAREIFEACRCTDAQTLVMMAECYKETGYMIDPHTAVGLFAAWATERDPAVPVVALACAHPAKFPDAVEKATGIRPPLPAHMADLYDRKEKFTVLPDDQTQLQDFVRKNVIS